MGNTENRFWMCFTVKQKEALELGQVLMLKAVEVCIRIQIWYWKSSSTLKAPLPATEKKLETVEELSLERFSLMGAIKHASCVYVRERVSVCMRVCVCVDMQVCLSECVLTWCAGWKHHTSLLEITHGKSKQPQMTSRSLPLKLSLFLPHLVLLDKVTVRKLHERWAKMEFVYLPW